ncbi:hypothetical protein D2E25_1835 [Bifidobacterium goeldii]|uniref:Uncharacterized protein n=1 Tax=Bifidobacterium goeldii TaxID=2306975 RepID=A0A430FF56_9BIFI|nr:hypothetical protein D2E25_1835 [Bifidobacterium goeldii]
MQVNINHHEAVHNNAAHTLDSQYDAYMFAEYGIER